jgi:hypothetical protein
MDVWIPQALISQLWTKITGGSWYADIRPVRGDNPNKVAKYLSKYISKIQKGASLTQISSLQGFHLFESYGLENFKFPFIVNVDGHFLGEFGWKKMEKDGFGNAVKDWNREIGKRDIFRKGRKPTPFYGVIPRLESYNNRMNVPRKDL